MARRELLQTVIFQCVRSFPFYTFTVRKWICLRVKQMFPFVRKDSSDAKPPPPKKPSVDVKKEKHRCEGAGKYIPLYIAF